MNKKREEIKFNFIYVLLIVLITIFLLLIFYLIPNYSKAQKPGDIVGFPLKFLIIFLIFNLVFIGIPAAIHWLYVKDYSRIKSIWFFVLFGVVTGVILGEGGNLTMIFPYAILMLFYALLYKKFVWWKVAVTSYLAGIIIENIINRAPIQVTTLIWIAFFTCPYFVTKIFDNRKKVSMFFIIKEFKFSLIFSFLLGLLAWYLSRNNSSPPLIVFGITLPFIVSVVYKLIKLYRNNENLHKIF